MKQQLQVILQTLSHVSPFVVFVGILLIAGKTSQYQESIWITNESLSTEASNWLLGIVIGLLYLVTVSIGSLCWALIKKDQVLERAEIVCIFLSASLAPIVLMQGLHAHPSVVVPLSGAVLTSFTLLYRLSRTPAILDAGILLFATFVIMVALGWKVATSMEDARRLGSLGIGVLCCIVFASAVAGMFGILSIKFLGVTAYRYALLLILITLILFAAIDRENTAYRSTLESAYASKYKSAHPSKYFEAHIVDWIKSKSEAFKSDKTTPIYVVVSEGGGLRAAQWASSVLGALDGATDGEFSKNVIAFSGVSGGAVGLGYALACRHPESKVIDHSCLENAVNQDFLAPVLARLLLVEPLRVLLGPDFAKPREVTFEKMLATVPDNEFAGRFMSSNIRASSAPGSEPMFFWGTTDALTGNRVYFSNTFLNHDVHPLMQADGQGGLDAGLLSAIDDAQLNPTQAFALHSTARFPVISAPARFGRFLLVDGGYRENSGSQEVSILLPALMKMSLGTSDLRYVVERDVNCMLGGLTLPKALNDCDDGEYDNVRQDKKRASAYRKEVEPLVLKRPIRVITLRNSPIPETDRTNHLEPREQGASSLGNEKGETRVVIDAILSSRKARTTEALLSIQTQFNATKHSLSGECGTDFGVRQLEPNRLITEYLRAASSHRPCGPLFQNIILEFSGDVPLHWQLSKRSREELNTAARDLVAKHLNAILAKDEPYE